MKKTWKLVLVSLLVALVGGLGACGDAEGNGEDNQNQNQNQNQTENQTENQTPSEVPSLCDDHDAWSLSGDGQAGAQFQSDYDLRMTEFVFNSNSPGSILNSIIKDNLEDQTYNYPIVVLIELRDIDVATDVFQIRGGAGLKADNDGNYEWDPGENEDLEPDFTEGAFHESGEILARLPLLNFVATIELENEVVKTLIPIRELDLHADLEAEADGTIPRIEGGNLRGIVVGEEIEDTRITLSPGTDGLALSQALGGEGAMNFDYNCDGQADSWLLTATFSAEETSIVE